MKFKLKEIEGLIINEKYPEVKDLFTVEFACGYNNARNEIYEREVEVDEEEISEIIYLDKMIDLDRRETLRISHIIAQSLPRILKAGKKEIWGTDNVGVLKVNEAMVAALQKYLEMPNATFEEICRECARLKTNEDKSKKEMLELFDKWNNM